MNAAIQFSFEAEALLLPDAPLLAPLFVPLSALLSLRITSKAMVPESKRIMVKLAASIVSSPNASRHKTELAAKAMSAHAVKKMVFGAEILVASMLCLITWENQ